MSIFSDSESVSELEAETESIKIVDSAALELVSIRLCSELCLAIVSLPVGCVSAVPAGGPVVAVCLTCCALYECAVSL